MTTSERIKYKIPDCHPGCEVHKHTLGVLVKWFNREVAFVSIDSPIFVFKGGHVGLGKPTKAAIDYAISATEPAQLIILGAMSAGTTAIETFLAAEEYAQETLKGRNIPVVGLTNEGGYFQVVRKKKDKDGNFTEVISESLLSFLSKALKVTEEELIQLKVSNIFTPGEERLHHLPVKLQKALDNIENITRPEANSDNIFSQLGLEWLESLTREEQQKVITQRADVEDWDLRLSFEESLQILEERLAKVSVSEEEREYIVSHRSLDEGAWSFDTTEELSKNEKLEILKRRAASKQQNTVLRRQLEALLIIALHNLSQVEAHSKDKVDTLVGFCCDGRAGFLQDSEHIRSLGAILLRANFEHMKQILLDPKIVHIAPSTFHVGNSGCGAMGAIKLILGADSPLKRIKSLQHLEKHYGREVRDFFAQIPYVEGISSMSVDDLGKIFAILSQCKFFELLHEQAAEGDDQAILILKRIQEGSIESHVFGIDVTKTGDDRVVDITPEDEQRAEVVIQVMKKTGAWKRFKMM